MYLASTQSSRICWACREDPAASARWISDPIRLSARHSFAISAFCVATSESRCLSFVDGDWADTTERKHCVTATQMIVLTLAICTSVDRNATEPLILRPQGGKNMARAGVPCVRLCPNEGSRAGQPGTSKRSRTALVKRRLLPLPETRLSGRRSSRLIAGVGQIIPLNSPPAERRRCLTGASRHFRAFYKHPADAHTNAASDHDAFQTAHAGAMQPRQQPWHFRLWQPPMAPPAKVRLPVTHCIRRQPARHCRGYLMRARRFRIDAWRR